MRNSRVMTPLVVLTIAAFLLVGIRVGPFLVVPVVVLAALGLVIFLIGRFAKSEGFQERRLYAELLRRAQRDPDRVERLVERERKRHPNATRAQLLKRCLDEMNRDRR